MSPGGCGRMGLNRFGRGMAGCPSHSLDATREWLQCRPQHSEDTTHGGVENCPQGHRIRGTRSRQSMFLYQLEGPISEIISTPKKVEIVAYLPALQHRWRCVKGAAYQQAFSLSEKLPTFGRSVMFTDKKQSCFIILLNYAFYHMMNNLK